MGVIRTDALTLLDRTLGISGQRSSQTEIDDGNLSQVLSVNDIVRRSRALVGTTGAFSCILQNVHAAADVQTTIANPYILGSGNVAPYPDPVPVDLDFWLLSVTAKIQAGTLADFSQGVLLIATPSGLSGWGRVGAAALVSDSQMCQAHWDSALSLTGVDPLITASGEPMVRIGSRIRRGSTIQFITETGAANGVTLRCNMQCALLPAGLGQDVAS